MDFEAFLGKLAATYVREIAAPGETRIEEQKIKQARYADEIYKLRLDVYTLTVIAFDEFGPGPFDPLRMPMRGLTFGQLYEYTVQKRALP